MRGLTACHGAQDAPTCGLRVPAAPRRRARAAAGRTSLGPRATLRPGSVARSKPASVVTEYWVGGEEGTRVLVLADGLLVYSFGTRARKQHSQSSGAQQPPPGVAILGDGDEAKLLRSVARALGWAVSMSEEGVSVGKDPPAGVVVECGKQQVPSHSSGRTTTPRDFAAQVTSTCTLLALCGDVGSAGAVLARLLAALHPQVPVATALRLAEPNPATLRRAAGCRLVLELGAMSGDTESAVQGLAPAILLLLNVPPADVAPCARLATQLRPGGALLACGDDAGAMAVVAALRDGPAQNAGAAPRALVTFGIGDANDWRACNVTRGSGTVAFDITLRRGGRVPGARITLPADPTLSAEHQVSATLGALLAACLLDAGAAHAAEGGHMDLVAAAVDIPELLASAKAAAALTGEP